MVYNKLCPKTQGPSEAAGKLQGEASQEVLY